MSEKQPKKKKTAGDIVLTVVLIAAICVFCYAGYNLFHIYTEYKKGTDEYNEIAQMAVTERDPDGEEAGTFPIHPAILPTATNITCPLTASTFPKAGIPARPPWNGSTEMCSLSIPGI